jgi:hypothetical protein
MLRAETLPAPATLIRPSARNSTLSGAKGTHLAQARASLKVIGPMPWPPHLPRPTLGDADIIRLRDWSRENPKADDQKRSGCRRALLACILSADESVPQDPLVTVLGRLGLSIRSEQHGCWRIHRTGDTTRGVVLDRRELETVRLGLALDAGLRCALQNACAEASQAVSRGGDPVNPAMEFRLSLAVREAQTVPG